MSPNIRSLVLSRLPLGVECRDCRHRALVDLVARGAHDGDMTELRALKLVCADCGSRRVRTTVFVTQQQVLAFKPDSGPEF